MSEKRAEAAETPPPKNAKADFHPRPCPICGKMAVFDTRPFCSKRCADVDLHRWLGGAYAIPVVEGDASEQDPAGDE